MKVTLHKTQWLLSPRYFICIILALFKDLLFSFASFMLFFKRHFDGSYHMRPVFISHSGLWTCPFNWRGNWVLWQLACVLSTRLCCFLGFTQIPVHVSRLNFINWSHSEHTRDVHDLQVGCNTTFRKCRILWKKYVFIYTFHKTDIRPKAQMIGLRLP